MTAFLRRITRVRKDDQRGFALAETIISAAFTAVALAGAFALAGTVRKTGELSAMRQRLDAITADVTERIRADLSNITSYQMTLHAREGHCEDNSQKIGSAAEASRLRWCQALNDVYPWEQGLTRQITLSSAGAGRQLVTVWFQAGDPARPLETVAKRIIETPP